MLILDREIMQAPRSPLITLSPSSPSFDSYSFGHKLADIAARVIQELSISDHQPPPTATTNMFSWNINNNNCEEQEHEHHHQQQQEGEEEEEEEEFEFTFVYGPETEQTSPVSADDIFYNGKIMPVYPLFDTALLHNNNNNTQTGLLPTEAAETPTKTVRLSLRKLFYQENLMSSSSSLSESDHRESYQDAGDGTEQLPPGTYCVWSQPKKGGEGKESGHSKMKSNSTGSSKRWKLRDLLHRRSNSDGKETFAFLAPAGKRGHGSRGGGGERVGTERRDSCVKETKVGGLKQSCEKTGEVKRQSYLPYRRELIGYFLMG